MTHHRITTTIALALALAATAAPVASADPAPLAHAEAAIANASPHTQPSTGPCSEVCSGDGYSTVHLTTATPPSTEPCSEVCSGSGYGSVKTTATDPTYTGPCSEVCSGGSYGSLTTPASTRDVSGAALPHDPRPRSEVISGGYGTPNVPATVVRVVAPGSGFDWGDAGIGAGSTLALTLIALAGVLAATNHRGRQTPDQHPTTSS